jgi:hypothetical protein
MVVVNYKVTFAILAAFTVLFTNNTSAFSFDISPNKIIIGRDLKNDSDVYLYKFGIVNVSKNIKRATHSIEIDGLTNEFTADYNCFDKSMHIFKVTIKDSDSTLEEKDLDVNEKVVKGTLDSNLLYTVCTYKNSTLYPARRQYFAY